MKHSEPHCCFDASMCLGHPDAEPCPRAVDVPRVVTELDRLQNGGHLSEAQMLLEHWTDIALRAGDWRGELSLQSELMGLHRRTGDKKAAGAAVERGLELIRLHRLGGTVSGATIILNAATTMKFLGKASDALPLFRHASRIYAEQLDPSDYRFAGLYNNMALVYQDTGDYESAERHFRMALDIIKSCRDPGNDTAVTLCNLAELYERMGREQDIEPMLDRAYGCLTDPALPRDGYNAFTLSKCIPTFDHFGYFIYVKALRERMEEINERT